MVTIKLQHSTETGLYVGFTSEGHAEYAEEGSDIVCSAISVLMINTVNSLDELTGAAPSYEEDADAGIMILNLQNPKDEGAQLLIKSLELGLKGIVTSYGTKYLNVIKQEV